MRIQRTLPPTAAPVVVADMAANLAALARRRLSLEGLQAEMQEHFHAPCVLFASSGKAALAVILATLASQSPRRTVVIPAYTCFSVPSAVRKIGLRIAPCDLDPDTLDFDFAALQRLVGDDTLCVVPTHLLGVPSDVGRVGALCRERGAFVVEDAAQAMGGTHRGRLLGTQGDVGFFSFGRGKNITCGSGGMIVAGHGAVGAALRAVHAALPREPVQHVLRDILTLLAMRLLLNPSAYWLPAGLPFLRLGESVFHPDFPVHRMHPLRAALLAGWRQRLAEANRWRRQAAAAMIPRLPTSVRVVPSGGQTSPTYLRLPVLARSRHAKAEICRQARAQGLGISPLYPASVPGIPELSEELKGWATPGAQALSDRLLTVPVHHLVGREDRQRICSLLAAGIDPMPWAAGAPVADLPGHAPGAGPAPSAE